MFGGLILLLIYLLNPITPYTSIILTANLLLMVGLAFMAEDRMGKQGYEPMSGLRTAFSFWFTFLGGAAALFGGMLFFIGVLSVTFGSYLIFSEWRRRRYWLSKIAVSTL